MLAGRETLKVAGDEVVVQFENGPMFYARHDCFASPNPSGGNGLGIAGPRGGEIEVDDITIWAIEREVGDDWAETRRWMPLFEAVLADMAEKHP
ncbi:MAG: hypothetical protein AAGD22_08480 [Verrucomicrobiota bacterium]